MYVFAKNVNKFRDSICIIYLLCLYIMFSIQMTPVCFSFFDQVLSKYKHFSEDEQSILFETLRPHRLFSEPTLTLNDLHMDVPTSLLFIYGFLLKKHLFILLSSLLLLYWCSNWMNVLFYTCSNKTQQLLQTTHLL